MAEYSLKLNIKANESDLKKIGQKINKQAQPSGTPSPKVPESGGLLGGIKPLLLKLGVIAGVLMVLKDLLSPILQILTVMMTLIFMPLISILVGLLRPFLMLGIKWFRDNLGNLTEGAAIAGAGMETMIKAPGSQVMEDYIEGIKKMSEANTFFGDLMTYLGGVLSPFVALFSGIKSIFSGEFFTKEYWQKVWSGITVVLDWVGTALSNSWNWIVNGLNDIWGWLKGAWDSIITGLGNVWEWLKTAWSNIIDGLAEVWNTFIFGLDKIWSFLKGIWDSIIGTLDKAWGFLKRVWDNIIGILDKAWTRIKSVWDNIINGLSNIWTKLKESWDRLIDGIVNLLSKIPGVGSVLGRKQFGGTIPETGNYLLHSGERVIPSGQNITNNTPTINVTIQGSVNDNNLNEIIRQLTKAINRRTGGW